MVVSVPNNIEEKPPKQNGADSQAGPHQGIEDSAEDLQKDMMCGRANGSSGGTRFRC